MFSRRPGSRWVSPACPRSESDVRMFHSWRISRLLLLSTALAVALIGASLPVADAVLAPARAHHKGRGNRTHHRRSSRRRASLRTAAVPLPAALHTSAPDRSQNLIWAVRPLLKARGRRLTWRLPIRVARYVLETQGRPSLKRRTTYRVVKGTSFTPPAVPGRMMKYRLRADRPAALWSKVVPITYAPKRAAVAAPAPASVAAPVKAASPAPVTPAASGPMMVGLDPGWGSVSASDMKAGGLTLARINTTLGGTEIPRTYHGDGIKVIATFPGGVNGSYNSGGVSAINVSDWVNMATSYYASQCAGSTSYCPAIEVLNEPFGSWFWGSNADSPQNGAAYARLLQAVHQAFQSKYGAGAPKILASYKPDPWWSGMLSAVPNITSDIDGVVVHAYGGVGSPASSAPGNRGLVTQAHSVSGRPVWVTEFGWPTALGQSATLDSLQWTQTQQADNIYNFVNWARSTGYVAAATYFNYRDYSSTQWYGVERSNGGSQYAKKPGWYALAESAAGQSCTVC
jgi:hypothetical protein